MRGQLLEGLELDAERAVGGAGDLGFELAELGGGEAHLAGQRLAVDEGRVERRRHQLVAVLRRHLDEIAEHVVVADLQRLHGRGVGIARLQRRDHAAGFVAQRARLVERGVVARAHEAAVALEVREARRRAPPRARRRSRHRAGAAPRPLARAPPAMAALLVELGRELGGGDDAVADGGEVARAAAADHQPRQRAGEIGRGLEARAHAGARGRVGHEERRPRRGAARSPPDR